MTIVTVQGYLYRYLHLFSSQRWAFQWWLARAQLHMLLQNEDLRLYLCDKQFGILILVVRFRWDDRWPLSATWLRITKVMSREVWGVSSHTFGTFQYKSIGTVNCHSFTVQDSCDSVLSSLHLWRSCELHSVGVWIFQNFKFYWPKMKLWKLVTPILYQLL